jgi:thioester reductase-like protein
LTGCTGFLGKVLVEKILRSIPEIGKIYLLVRGKRNMNASERLLDILSSRLFSVCKKNMGEEEFMKMALDKIQPIEGDLILEGLGLSNADKEMLLNNV